MSRKNIKSTYKLLSILSTSLVSAGIAAPLSLGLSSSGSTDAVINPETERTVINAANTQYLHHFTGTYTMQDDGATGAPYTLQHGTFNSDGDKPGWTGSISVSFKRMTIECDIDAIALDQRFIEGDSNAGAGGQTYSLQQLVKLGLISNLKWYISTANSNVTVAIQQGGTVLKTITQFSEKYLAHSFMNETGSSDANVLITPIIVGNIATSPNPDCTLDLGGEVTVGVNVGSSDQGTNGIFSGLEGYCTTVGSGTAATKEFHVRAIVDKEPYIYGVLGIPTGVIGWNNYNFDTNYGSVTTNKYYANNESATTTGNAIVSALATHVFDTSYMIAINKKYSWQNPAGIERAKEQYVLAQLNNDYFCASLLAWDTIVNQRKEVWMNDTTYSTYLSNLTNEQMDLLQTSIASGKLLSFGSSKVLPNVDNSNGFSLSYQNGTDRNIVQLFKNYSMTQQQSLLNFLMLHCNDTDQQFRDAIVALQELEWFTNARKFNIIKQADGERWVGLDVLSTINLPLIIRNAYDCYTSDGLSHRDLSKLNFKFDVSTNLHYQSSASVDQLVCSLMPTTIDDFNFISYTGKSTSTSIGTGLFLYDSTWSGGIDNQYLQFNTLGTTDSAGGTTGGGIGSLYSDPSETYSIWDNFRTQQQKWNRSISTFDVGGAAGVPTLTPANVYTALKPGQELFRVKKYIKDSSSGDYVAADMTDTDYYAYLDFFHSLTFAQFQTVWAQYFYSKGTHDVYYPLPSNSDLIVRLDLSMFFQIDEFFAEFSGTQFIISHQFNMTDSGLFGNGPGTADAGKTTAIIEQGTGDDVYTTNIYAPTYILNSKSSSDVRDQSDDYQNDWPHAYFSGNAMSVIITHDMHPTVVPQVNPKLFYGNFEYFADTFIAFQDETNVEKPSALIHINISKTQLLAVADHGVQNQSYIEPNGTNEGKFSIVFTIPNTFDLYNPSHTYSTDKSPGFANISFKCDDAGGDIPSCVTYNYVTPTPPVPPAPPSPTASGSYVVLTLGIIGGVVVFGVLVYIGYAQYRKHKIWKDDDDVDGIPNISSKKVDPLDTLVKDQGGGVL